MDTYMADLIIACIAAFTIIYIVCSILISGHPTIKIDDYRSPGHF